MYSWRKVQCLYSSVCRGKPLEGAARRHTWFSTLGFSDTSACSIPAIYNWQPMYSVNKAFQCDSRYKNTTSIVHRGWVPNILLMLCLLQKKSPDKKNDYIRSSVNDGKITSWVFCIEQNNIDLGCYFSSHKVDNMHTYLATNKTDTNVCWSNVLAEQMLSNHFKWVEL